MKNKIYLKGIIKNIQYSHSIGNIDFNKADLIVRRSDGREDLINIKFKKFNTNCIEDSEVELLGNIRSFSYQSEDKNKVNIYVFTHLDRVEDQYESENVACLEGTICKMDPLRVTSKGKHYIHFILANNLDIGNNQRINSYIPCVAWGLVAQDINNNYNVSDKVKLEGQLHSREYKKKLDENNLELRLAHEFATLSVVKI